MEDYDNYCLENTYAELMGYRFRLKVVPDDESEELYFSIRERMNTDEELKEFRSVMKERTIKMLRYSN